ncbi:MAG TPA: hypothetical protein DCO75_00465 [Fibrobacteres bacterium]|jgi:hypothetical protein|nr:hypothetical protein [Fibrobacterota bacterium]
MALTEKDFKRSVFVNCPFDGNYMELLRPLLFTLLYSGFIPRIALESSDSSITRISKIVDLITQSRYAIHDISRCQSTGKGELFRFNMPFELGLDIGCKLFKNGRWTAKKCLILEAEKFRYQAALSDLSNSDIADHNNDPETLLRKIRNWLVQDCEACLPAPTVIWGRFLDFMADNYDRLAKEGWTKKDIASQPMKETLRDMTSWIKKI